MQWPTDINAPSPQNAALSLNAEIKSVIIAVKAWRASIAATGQVDPAISKTNYQNIVTLRRDILAARTIVGIGPSLKTLYPNADPAFDPLQAGTDVQTAITAFVTWFKGAWPKTTAGNPSFDAFDPVTDDITNIPFALGATQQTNALARLDALIAAFT